MIANMIIIPTKKVSAPLGVKVASLNVAALLEDGWAGEFWAFIIRAKKWMKNEVE
jgi:hypothetical protein